MHELSIAMSIIDIAQEYSHEHDGAVILAIHVKVGRMAGIVTDALRSAFEMAREDTSLCDTKLVIEDLPVMLDCRECGCEQPADSIQSLCCSECGTLSPNITQGYELEVFAMEIEEVEQV